MISLPLKAQAVRLAGMAFVLNSPEDSRFFLYLSTLLVAVYFVCVPNGLLCVMIFAPSAIFPTPFYEACLDTLSRMGDSALVSKVLYKELLSVESSPPHSYIVSGLRLSGQGFLSMVTGLSSGIRLLRILRMMAFG